MSAQSEAEAVWRATAEPSARDLEAAAARALADERAARYEPETITGTAMDGYPVTLHVTMCLRCGAMVLDRTLHGIDCWGDEP